MPPRAPRDARPCHGHTDGCGSAGRTATPTAKNVSSAATRSVPECTASDTSPRLPLARPVDSFSPISAQAAPTETSAVRRWGVTAEAYGSTDSGVQRPAVGDALQLVLPALLELDPRPCNEIADGARHEHFVRLGYRGHPGADVHRDSGDAPPRAALPPRRAARTARGGRYRRTSSRMCQAQRIALRGAVERGQHAVSGRVLQGPVVQLKRALDVCARSARGRCASRCRRASLARCVEPATSMKATVASTLSASDVCVRCAGDELLDRSRGKSSSGSGQWSTLSRSSHWAPAMCSAR